MEGDEVLKRVDPGTGLTLEQLIEAFVSDPEDAKSIKKYIISVNEAKKHAEEEK